jgi:hypothetical protein
MNSFARHSFQAWQDHLPRSPLRAPRVNTWLRPNVPQDTLRADSVDVMDQMLLCDSDDRKLLRLVLCAAVATLILALACSLVG